MKICFRRCFSSYHQRKHFTIIITSTSTETKHFEPTFFSFSKSQNRLMNFASIIFDKVFHDIFKNSKIKRRFFIDSFRCFRFSTEFYSMNRSWVIASSGNGTDWSKSPRWGRQSSNDDLNFSTILRHVLNEQNLISVHSSRSINSPLISRFTSACRCVDDVRERKNEVSTLVEEQIQTTIGQTRSNDDPILFCLSELSLSKSFKSKENEEKITRQVRLVGKIINENEVFFCLHCLQHFRVTNQLTFGFFFISATTFFIVESKTEKKTTFFKMTKNFISLLFPIFEEIVNRSQTNRNEVRKNSRKRTNHCWSVNSKWQNDEMSMKIWWKTFW